MIGGFEVPGEPCPLIDRGYLILINEDGTQERGRYQADAAHLFSPLYLNGMIIVHKTSNESAGTMEPVPNSILVLDVSDPYNITLIEETVLSFKGRTAISGGSTVSVSDGMIYTGNGFFGFGPQQGLYAIGLGDGDD